MHSRLFVISKNNMLVREITEQDLIDEGFTDRVADYVDEIKDEERKSEDIVNWLFPILKSMFEDLIELDEKEFSFKLKKGATRKFLTHKLDKIERMLEEESRKENRDIRNLLYDIYLEIRDECSFNFAYIENDYVCWRCMDDFFEFEYNEEQTFYITQVYDYHH